MRASKLIYRLQKWHTSRQARTRKHPPELLLHEGEHKHTQHTHTHSWLYLEGWCMIGNKCKARSERKLAALDHTAHIRAQQSRGSESLIVHPENKANLV